MNPNRLAARITLLEAENERIFREAQLAADTMFAQYQLSQIVASHETPHALAEAVLDELIHVCGARGGAVWTIEPRSGQAVVAASRGTTLDGIRFDELARGPEVQRVADTSWARVPLDDGSRRVGLLALTAPLDRPLSASALRFLSLVRHELAVALRAAQLREALDLERAELSAIIEGASDAIVLVDERRRVIRINAAAARTLGMPHQQLVGRSCEAALDCHSHRSAESAGWPCERCPFEQVLRSGEAVTGHERTLGREGEDPVHVVGSYTLASRSAVGRALVVAIFRDTTEIAQLQELRRGFLASISHELRTPLALIKGYVETLLYLPPEPTVARDYLHRIDRTSERLAGLVTQILDVTQLAAGELALEREDIAPAALLEAAADELRDRQPRLHLRVEVEAGLPELNVDAARLRQVLDNLLANAAKYGSPDGRILLSARRDDDEIVIGVADDGIGVPADEREMVFEQFHRGRNVRESHLPGYGLGLSISRRLVEAHGGSLAFDPAIVDGTRLLLRLPLRMPRASVATPIAIG